MSKTIVEHGVTVFDVVLVLRVLTREQTETRKLMQATTHAPPPPHGVRSPAPWERRGLFMEEM